MKNAGRKKNVSDDDDDDVDVVVVDIDQDSCWSKCSALFMAMSCT